MKNNIARAIGYIFALLLVIAGVALIVWDCVSHLENIAVWGAFAILAGVAVLWDTYNNPIYW